MLHLLDPQVYPLDGLADFKQRVSLRQEIAECMLSLTESESNFFLEQAIEELGDLLSSDNEVQLLRLKLTELIQNDVAEDDPTRLALIRSIRTHVSDVWRLHRRILRNRRTSSSVRRQLVRAFSDN
jgi:ATP-dependent helicase HepA